MVDQGIVSDFRAAGNHTDFSAPDETVGDGIARAAAQVAQAGGQGIIAAVNPMDWLGANLVKAQTSGIYLGMPPSLASRVVAVRTIPSGYVLSFSLNAVAWADRMKVSVTAGLAEDDYIRNATRLLAEARGAPSLPGLRRSHFGR